MALSVRILKTRVSIFTLSNLVEMERSEQPGPSDIHIVAAHHRSG
jgi:hypothetical protein